MAYMQRKGHYSLSQNGSNAFSVSPLHIYDTAFSALMANMCKKETKFCDAGASEIMKKK